MDTRPSESGFTLVELMIASLITLVVVGVAFSTFKDALALNDAAIEIADSSQNLRAGTNLLVRDLQQAGRNLRVGGISIPSGVGATAINRPSPPGKSYMFNNTTEATLQVITSGMAMGPVVDGRPTDMITILTDDPFLDDLGVYEITAPSALPRIANDGSSINVGLQTAWLGGVPSDGIAPIKPGDLLYFTGAGQDAIQTVTRVVGSNIYFDPGDPFNFNQRNAASGTVMATLPQTPYVPGPPPGPPAPAIVVRRLQMLTYYVHEESAGVPRLMRMLNHFPPKALAGIMEDLEFTFDLVDGTVNPTNVESLPHIVGGVTYSASQIRKVNLHVGVRSERKSERTRDYLRNHLSTTVSLRNLAYVDRYK